MLEQPHKIGKDRFAGGGGIFTQSSFCYLWKSQRDCLAQRYFFCNHLEVFQDKKSPSADKASHRSGSALHCKETLVIPNLAFIFPLMSEGGCHGRSLWGSGVSWTQGQLNPRTLSHASEKKSFKPVASRKLPKYVRLQRAPGDHKKRTASTQVLACAKNVKRK